MKYMTVICLYSNHLHTEMYRSIFFFNSLYPMVVNQSVWTRLILWWSVTISEPVLCFVLFCFSFFLQLIARTRVRSELVTWDSNWARHHQWRHSTEPEKTASVPLPGNDWCSATSVFKYFVQGWFNTRGKQRLKPKVIYSTRLRFVSIFKPLISRLLKHIPCLIAALMSRLRTTLIYLTVIFVFLRKKNVFYFRKPTDLVNNDTDPALTRSGCESKYRRYTNILSRRSHTRWRRLHSGWKPSRSFHRVHHWERCPACYVLLWKNP